MNAIRFPKLSVQLRMPDNVSGKNIQRKGLQSVKSKKTAIDAEMKKQSRPENAENYMKRKLASTLGESQSKCKNRNKKQKYSRKSTDCVGCQKDYLKQFDKKNGRIHEQTWAKSNNNKFHKSILYFITQCTICREAWPLKSKPKSPNTYVCSRCSRDKVSPKKFSCENSMIPSPVPDELEGLSQVEEMLIPRALPIMRDYIKPGGQRGYSGHCINLPQDVKELAKSLPRYPKELSLIIVKVRGKDNTFKDVHVRREKVHKALLWLIENNPYYSELEIHVNALNLLPENGIPSNLMTVETIE